MAEDFILTTQGLAKEFRGIVAVDGVDLAVRRGTVHALIGPNGAGKTTCFNLLTKFLSPTRGTITYNGRDITRTPPADVARLGLVRSFQISATFPHLSVLENVRVALQRRRGGNFDFWRSEKLLRRFDGEARDLIDQVGLQGFEGGRAADLSYGRKRALEIATTLALAPDLMLLDEPMAGMAHEDIDRTAACPPPHTPPPPRLPPRAGAGRTVLMVEHNLSVVASLSDRITVLARGKVLAEGSYDHVSRDPRVVEAYIGVGHG